MRRLALERAKVKDYGGPGGHGSPSIVVVVVVKPRFIGAIYTVKNG